MLTHVPMEEERELKRLGTVSKEKRGEREKRKRERKKERTDAQAAVSLVTFLYSCKGPVVLLRRVRPL